MPFIYLFITTSFFTHGNYNAFVAHANSLSTASKLTSPSPHGLLAGWLVGWRRATTRLLVPQVRVTGQVHTTDTSMSS
jgi:hypothetical protein